MIPIITTRDIGFIQSPKSHPGYYHCFSKVFNVFQDPFEDFRKMRAGGYYKRVKDYQGK